MSDRQEDEDALSRKHRLAEEGSEAAEHEENPAPPREAAGKPQAAAAPDAAEPIPADPPHEVTVFIPRITVAAFVQDAAFRKALTGAAEDRRMMRASLELAEGDIRTAVQTFREHAPPELVLVESRLGEAELFEELERLAEQCPPGTSVIVLGHQNDVRLYRRLLKSGVGDYLVAPVRPIAVIEAIGQIFHEGAADRSGKVVAFIGARGGAGSSTIALNVAAAMGHHCHASALLIDLDLAFGTVGLDLNLEPANGVREALDEGERLDATLLDRLTAAYNERLGVLTAPCTLGELPRTDPDALGQLIDTARTVTPHLLLDLPAEWTAAVRRALLAADEIVLTASPDLAGLRNARNIVATLRSARQNDLPPRLVLNGFGLPKRKELTSDDYKRVLELEPSARVPHDPLAFSQASARGEPVALTSSGTAQPFRELAAILTGQKDATKPRGGVGQRLRRLLAGQP